MKTSLKIRTACAFLLLGSAAVTGLGSWQESYALPPGGASTVDTPGTSSTVSPQTLKAGDTLSFTVSGFPAGQQLYVKVDDGEACPSDSAQGACVVHQQKISSNGTVSGSFVLSKQLAEGQHTLRFLATEVKTDSQGNNIGSIGYTNRSPEFTISGVNENSSGGSVVNVDPDVINRIEQDAAGGSSNNQNQNDSGSQSQTNSGSQSGDTGNQGGADQSGGASQSQDSSGQTIYLDADGNQITKEEYDALMAAQDQEAVADDSQTQASSSASATASASASAKASSSAQETETGQSVEASASKGSSVPWIGIIALAGAVVIAAVVLILRRRSAS